MKEVVKIINIMKFDIDFSQNEIISFLKKEGFIIELIEFVDNYSGKIEARTQVAYLPNHVPEAIKNHKKQTCKDYWFRDLHGYYRPEIVFNRLMEEKIKTILLK